MGAFAPMQPFCNGSTVTLYVMPQVTVMSQLVSVVLHVK